MTWKKKQEKLRQEQEQQKIESAENKGKLEKSFEIAKNFKADGIPYDIISKNTGLTIEQIEKL